MVIWNLLVLVGILLILILLTSFFCFLKVFYSPKRKERGADEFETPKGAIYDPYRDEMLNWTKEMRALPYEEWRITSYDGLTLYGKYYECRKGALTEIMFHGYRGDGERDLCGGVARCFALGRNALIVDQRASGKSDGHVITFGIRESRDCLSWAEHAMRVLGEEVPLQLTGISMGAATVLIASGEPLPRSVVAILADCGYTSAEEIIKKVIKDMHLPPVILFPFVSLGARLFGRFSLKERSPIEGVRKAKLPILFFHGEADDFVPVEMSERMQAACASPSRLVRVEGAGHGLAFSKNKEAYLFEMRRFEEQHLHQGANKGS